MDNAVANIAIRPIHFASFNRGSFRPLKRTWIPIRVRCEGGSRHTVEGQREHLKRNEVVDLLSTALSVLLLPENQKRLKERLQNCKQSKAVLAEVPFPPHIVKQGPSEAPKEIWVEVFSSASQFGENSSPLEFPGEVYTAANYSSSGGLNIRRSEPPTDSVQQVSSSGMLKESDPTETGESIDADNQIISSASEMGIRGSEETDLSTMRRLKILNVHSYVRSALRESFLRSYLRSRKIEE